MRKRWLCLARRRGGAGWSRRTSLPRSSSSERRSGRGGARSAPSAPSTCSSTASERAHIRAATAAPCRAPLRAATLDAPARVRTRAPTRRGVDTTRARYTSASRRTDDPARAPLTLGSSHQCAAPLPALSRCCCTHAICIR